MNGPSLFPSVCFVVEKIIGVSSGDGNMKNYQVQWAPTWVSSSNLVGCQHLIQEFINKQQEQQEQELLDQQQQQYELHPNTSNEYENDHPSMDIITNNDTVNSIDPNQYLVKIEDINDEQSYSISDFYNNESDRNKQLIHTQNHCNDITKDTVLTHNKIDQEIHSSGHGFEQSLIAQFCHTCDECGRTFGSKNKLLYHQRSHKKYPCDQCEKVFAHSYNLEKHMVTHGNKLECQNRVPREGCESAICDEEYMMAMLKLPGPFIGYTTMKGRAEQKLRKIPLQQFFRCFRKLAQMNVGIVHEATKVRVNGHPLLLQKGAYENFHEEAKLLIDKEMYECRKAIDVNLNQARINILQSNPDGSSSDKSIEVLYQEEHSSGSMEPNLTGGTLR